MTKENDKIKISETFGRKGIKRLTRIFESPKEKAASIPRDKLIQLERQDLENKQIVNDDELRESIEKQVAEYERKQEYKEKVQEIKQEIVIVEREKKKEEKDQVKLSIAQLISKERAKKQTDNFLRNSIEIKKDLEKQSKIERKLDRKVMFTPSCEHEFKFYGFTNEGQIYVCCGKCSAVDEWVPHRWQKYLAEQKRKATFGCRSLVDM